MGSTGHRLGILGGTFDPIHHGHLVAAAQALDQLALDRVVWVPAGNPPHKPNGPLTGASHRVRMVELAIEGRSQFGLSLVDVNRPGPCYTVDTLALLHQEFGPGASLFFIEGSDSLADIMTWYKPERLLDLCDLAVVKRPGARFDLAHIEAHLPGLSDHIHWVDMPQLDISSSDVRARVRGGRSIAYLVPPKVETYIYRHNLYTTENVDLVAAHQGCQHHPGPMQEET